MIAVIELDLLTVGLTKMEEKLKKNEVEGSMMAVEQLMYTVVVGQTMEERGMVELTITDVRFTMTTDVEFMATDVEFMTTYVEFMMTPDVELITGELVV